MHCQKITSGYWQYNQIARYLNNYYLTKIFSKCSKLFAALVFVSCSFCFCWFCFYFAVVSCHKAQLHHLEFKPVITPTSNTCSVWAPLRSKLTSYILLSNHCISSIAGNVCWLFIKICTPISWCWGYAIHWGRIATYWKSLISKHSYRTSYAKNNDMHLSTYITLKTINSENTKFLICT